MTDTAISISNLSCTYINKIPNLQALSNVSISIQAHEFVSIIGPSGCGKSTLFAMIGDLIDRTTTHTTGDIKLQGMNPMHARTKRQIGIVFQKPALLPWRTASQNVALPLEIMGIRHDKSKICDLLSLVGLEKYGGYYPHQLSGGMQQKVSIARALAYDPPILLMDEPFGALDEISREAMNTELIKIWQKTKKTILFVTHSISEAVYLSQKVYVMSTQPGTIKGFVEIPLGYPRRDAEDKAEFYKYVVSIRQKLASP